MQQDIDVANTWTSRLEKKVDWRCMFELGESPAPKDAAPAPVLQQAEPFTCPLIK